MEHGHAHNSMRSATTLNALLAVGSAVTGVAQGSTAALSESPHDTVDVNTIFRIL